MKTLAECIELQHSAVELMRDDALGLHPDYELENATLHYLHRLAEAEELIRNLQKQFGPFKGWDRRVRAFLAAAAASEREG